MPLPHRDIISTHALLVQRMLLPRALEATKWLSNLSLSIAPDGRSAPQEWTKANDKTATSPYLPILTHFQASLYELELFADSHSGAAGRSAVLLESRRLLRETVEVVRNVEPEMAEKAFTYRSFAAWVQSGSGAQMGAMADFGGDLRIGWWADTWRREGF